MTTQRICVKKQCRKQYYFFLNHFIKFKNLLIQLDELNEVNLQLLYITNLKPFS